MPRMKNIVLLLVVFSSMAAGVVWPAVTRPLGAYLSWTLMGLLFLAFLKVFPPAIWDTLRRYPVKLTLLILAKLIMLPCSLYLAPGNNLSRPTPWVCSCWPGPPAGYRPPLWWVWRGPTSPWRWL